MEVNLVRWHEKSFWRINELMKKLASSLTINGLVPTYGYNAWKDQSSMQNWA